MGRSNKQQEATSATAESGTRVDKKSYNQQLCEYFIGQGMVLYFKHSEGGLGLHGVNVGKQLIQAALSKMIIDEGFD